MMIAPTTKRTDRLLNLLQIVFRVIIRHFELLCGLALQFWVQHSRSCSCAFGAVFSF